MKNIINCSYKRRISSSQRGTTIIGGINKLFIETVFKD